MPKYIRYFFILFSIAIGITMFVSCKKKTPADIGLPFLPAGDLLGTSITDTFSLITHTTKDDTLMTNRVDPNLLGTINDPIFGIASASIYTQIEPSLYNPIFGSTPQLDSVVLSLSFYGSKYYGSPATEKFDVYQINYPAFNWDSSYYSDKNLPYSNLLGSAYLNPDVNDSVIVGNTTVKLPPQLRIKLNKSYFANFFDSTKYVNYSTFQSFFNGLYIKTSSGASSGPGAILYIDLTNTLYSHLTMFYHGGIKTDSIGPLGWDTSFAFNVNAGTCAHFSHFDHDYSTYGASDLNYQINIKKDTMIPEDHVYVQSMAGVRTKVTLPYLKHFFDDGKKAINKAELIMNVEPNSILGGNGASTSALSCPPQLIANIADTVPIIMPDYFEGGAYFGGTYDSINHRYIFNISRYVQEILNGTRKDEGIYIMTPSSASGSFIGATTANRVQLIGGSKTLSGHMRLRIAYTPLNARIKSPVKKPQQTSSQPITPNQQQ